MAPTHSMHPLGDVEASPGPQVPAYKVRTQRLWVFRTVLILSLFAVLICYIVMWRRDKLTMSSQLRSLAEPVAALQAQVAELGRLPASKPELSGQTLAFYASDADRFYASQVTEPVIIATTHPVHLLLTEDGRGVIIYQQGKIETKWMTASEYEKAWGSQEAKIEAFEQQRKLRPLNLP